MRRPLLVLVMLSACSSSTAGRVGDDGGGSGGNGGASGDGASCTPEGQQVHPHDSVPAMHVLSYAGITPNSNPPSSGPHCAAWGRYATYSTDRPLPRCNYVHNLEHGAIVFVYNCPTGCPQMVADLQSIINAAPPDPNCPSRRLVLTPDADLDVPVAAAAWGYTWKSACGLDEAGKTALAAFITDHWGGDAPEPRVCGDGTVTP